MDLFRREDEDVPDFATVEELTEYLKSDLHGPRMLGRAEYDALSVSDRNRFNLERGEFLSRGIIVATPDVSAAVAKTRALMLDNLHATTGRSGLIIDGPGGSGKTTTAKAIARDIYRSYMVQFPDYQTRQGIPIAYVDVPPGSTGKLLASAFADFLGLTVLRRDTMDSLLDRIIHVLRVSRTHLVIVDELHRLRARTRANGESVQVLRHLHDRVPATFVFAGVKLGQSQLLTGAYGSQIRARFSRIPVTKLSVSTQADRSVWRGLVQCFESRLPLLAHEQGTLVDLSQLLHERARGSIGTLDKLIFKSAIHLINEGDPDREAVTADVIRNQLLDMEAEEGDLYDDDEQVG